VRRVDRARTVAGQIGLVSEAGEALVALSAKHLPLKDAPILAAALSANATVLVTGDRRHFGALFGKTLNRTVTALPPRGTGASAPPVVGVGVPADVLL